MSEFLIKQKINLNKKSKHKNFDDDSFYKKLITQYQFRLKEKDNIIRILKENIALIKKSK